MLVCVSVRKECFLHHNQFVPIFKHECITFKSVKQKKGKHRLNSFNTRDEYYYCSNNYTV